jgi:hypothetical protein
MRHDPAAQIGLKIAGEQEDAVIETALDPCLVVFHKSGSLAFVAGEFKQDDKHVIGPL